MRKDERRDYRDQLRSARYAALADAEGFGQICFVLEALGMRLLGEKRDLGAYRPALAALADGSLVLSDLSERFPEYFTKFSALYETIKRARNDAMHTGVYARHATAVAIELCIGLEEALMNGRALARETVADFMVKSPITLEPWQPVAHARQLMLAYSFSFLPVHFDRWQLVSEGAMAKYLNMTGTWSRRVAASIEWAAANGLHLIDAEVVDMQTRVADLIESMGDRIVPTLWLVEERPGKLCGVLSPFELM